MGNNSSKQGAVVRADADGDKPSEDPVFTFKWSVGFAGKRCHNLHKGDSAANTPSRSVIDSPESGRSVMEGARLGGIGRLLNNRRGMRGDMLPAGLEAEKSPSVITLYSFDGISAADASETPSVSSLPVDQRAHSDGVKTSSPVATRCIGPISGRTLACDVSSEPLLVSPNRTTMMTSLSVLALPSQGAVAPLDGTQRMRKFPTSMTDTTRPSGANFMSDTVMSRPRGARTKERAIVIDMPAGTNARDRRTPSYPPADRHPPADRCGRDAIALRTQMKTSEAGVMQQLRHEGIVAPGADELANRRKQESRSILSELRDMGLVSSAARDPPAPGSAAATTPRAPARLAAIEQGRTAQLRDLDDAEDLLDTLDLELEKGDLDYLSHGRERLLRRRRLPSCSAALVDAASAVERAEQERRSRRPEVRADSSTPEQMTDIGKVMKNLDLL